MSISINQENIEILFNALNKTKKRVKKLEKKTVGVNENEKNYNYDDSLERLFVITNGQTTRLNEIEERINGIVSLLGINEVPETSGRDEVSRLSFDVPIDDQVVVVTYSDRISEGLCRSMTSAAVHGFELRVFGLDAATSFAEFKGDPKKKKVLGMEKLFGNQTMQKQLGLHNESIIIFADAADVIYLDTLDKVKKRYSVISGEHGENPVLFAAERNCWPYMAGKQQRIPGGKAECAVFPDRNSTFRYLNSGAYIGKFRAIKAMLAAASEGLGATHADDQNDPAQRNAEQDRTDGIDPAFRARREIRVEHVDAHMAFFQKRIGTGEEEQRGIPEAHQVGHESLFVGEDEAADNDQQFGDNHEQRKPVEAKRAGKGSQNE